MAPPVDVIFKATYSGTPVYEMPCQGVAVMRRRSDAWLNATQILKVAGFDKPQRTRVLEREVQKGTHEKVQGGYGKYQGTWVPMDRGIALSRQYGVDRLLQPIFDYVPTEQSPPPAPKHISAAPVRPRKKGIDIADESELVLPVPKKQKQMPRPPTARQLAAQNQHQMETDSEAMGSQSLVDDRAFSPSPSQSSGSSRTPSPLGAVGEDDPLPGGSTNAGASAQAQLGTGPLRYARMILDYFVSESSVVPDFLITPPRDFDPDVIIDDDGHTALHWACAMGRIRIVKLLLTAGADIFRANGLGQTALMRSVMFTNNYDLRKFPELFELLHRSTINIDRNDRTVFHYIVDIALQKGKAHAARYYMETVLGRLSDFPREVADILNFQDEEGETALSLAARARSKRLVKLLLDNGADPKIVNHDGKSAEDYILEDEKFRATDGAGVLLAGRQGVLQSFIPTLRTSESGQRAITECVPKMVGMLETLASSFDAELDEKARDLSQAQGLLANLQAEIVEAQKTVASLTAQSSSFDSLEGRERQLQKDLAVKMGRRFRLGWEKWVRDEDKREVAYIEGNGSGEPDLDRLIRLASEPPVDGPTQAAELRNEVNALRREREELFGEFTKLQADAGTGTKLAQYRQLIALGCGVPLDAVDEVLKSLYETMVEDADYAEL